jgi:hypothetical protein
MALVRAQGTQPKASASDYPVHVQLDGVALAAKYLVHSVPTSGGTLTANSYLVVEVAFFGPPLGRIKLSASNFSLRVNGLSQVIPSQPSSMVSQSIRFPSAIVHTQQPTALSTESERGVAQRPGEDKVVYQVRIASLPDGEYTLPHAGLIYFLYNGRPAEIRSLDLLYDGPNGRSTLKLIP